MLKTRLMILAASGLLALAVKPGAAQAQYYGGGGYGRYYGPGPRGGWPGYGWAGYPRPYGYPYGIYPRPVFVPAPYAYAPPPVVYAPPIYAPPVYAPSPVYVAPHPVIRSHAVVRRPVVHRAAQPACFCGSSARIRAIPSPLNGPLPTLRPAPAPSANPPAINSFPPEHGS